MLRAVGCTAGAYERDRERERLPHRRADRRQRDGHVNSVFPEPPPL